MNKKNKKGWVKILESFLAILLIVAVMSIVISDDLAKKNVFSEKVYEVQVFILEKIQLNKNAREQILDLEELPIKTGDNDFPNELNAILNDEVPNGLNCSIKICDISSTDCILEDIPEKKEIYVKSSRIISQNEIYKPTKIALFCWRN